MATGSTATNVKLREGSDARYASNAAYLTPAYQLVVNYKIGRGSSFWGGMIDCLDQCLLRLHQRQR